LEQDYRARGWFLIEAEYPHVSVLLTATQLKPPAVVTGVAFDYTNYDAEPPSVRLVNPFTGVPFLFKELPTNLNRVVRPNGAPPPMIPGLPAGLMVGGQMEQLMQGYGPDDIPFLCVAGVREYHEHPAHTGDSWQLHRAGGAGRLVRLLDVIFRYGIQSIVTYSVTQQVSGFASRFVE
jgi:hypothetical protein